MGQTIEYLPVVSIVRVTEAQRRGFALRDVLRWMCSGPASLLRLPHGIRVGAAAHLVAFDPDAEWVIDRDTLHHRHPITPYHGKQVSGKVRQTFVHGCDDDRPLGEVL